MSCCENDQERITIAELAGALLGMGHGGQVSSMRVFEYVKKHREPKWQQGDVVLDADGNVFRRRNDGCWNRTGSNSVYQHTEPQRPLQRMVPEI